MNSLEEKFTSVIIDRLGFKKANIKEYRAKMKDTLEGQCPFNADEQGCIAGLIEKTLSDPMQKNLAADINAQEYQQLAEDPHKLLVKIVKDLDAVVFEPIVDHISALVNKAAGRDVIVKENGIRVAHDHNAAAMLNNGRRISSSREAEFLIMHEGIKAKRISIDEYETWDALSKIHNGLTTGLSESAQTIKFILNQLGDLSERNIKDLTRLITVNGKNFIKRLASQPLDPGASFRKFITTTDSSKKEATNIAESLDSDSYNSDIIGLTDRSLGVQKDKLSEFIALYKDELAQDILEKENMLKKINDSIENLVKEQKATKSNLEKTLNDRIEECRELIKGMPQYPMIVLSGHTELAAQMLAKQTIEKLKEHKAIIETRLEFFKMQRVGVLEYIKRKKDKTVFRCPAAYSTTTINNNGKQQKTNIVEACYKLVSERFLKAFQLSSKQLVMSKGSNEQIPSKRISTQES